MALERMYKVSEVAAAWSTSEPLIYALLRTGKLRSRVVGNGTQKPGRRIPESAIEEYLADVVTERHLTLVRDEVA